MKNCRWNRRRGVAFLIVLLLSMGSAGQRVSAMEELPENMLSETAEEPSQEVFPQGIPTVDNGKQEEPAIEEAVPEGPAIQEEPTIEEEPAIEEKPIIEEKPEIKKDPAAEDAVTEEKPGAEKKPAEEKPKPEKEPAEKEKTSEEEEPVTEEPMAKDTALAEDMPESEEEQLLQDISEDSVFIMEIPAELVLNRSFQFSLQTDVTGTAPEGEIRLTIEGTASPDNKAFGLYLEKYCWPYQLVIGGETLSPEANTILLPVKTGSVDVEVLPLQDAKYAGTYQGKLTFSVSFEG